MKYFIILTLLLSCGGKKRNPNEQPEAVRVVDMKYCMRECVKDSFEMFHKEGTFLGGGSSSMDGVSQSDIYTKVESSCDEFLEGERCCTLGTIHFGWVKHYFNRYAICKDKVK